MRVVAGVVGAVVVVALGLLALVYIGRWLLDALPDLNEERFWDLAYALVREQGFVTAVVAVVYLLVAVLARWNLIARPVRASIEGSMVAVQAKAQRCASRADIDRIDDLLDVARRRLQKERWLDRVFWRGAPEVEALQRINVAEEVLIPSLPAATVRAELIVTQARLTAVKRPDARALAANMKAALASEQTPAVLDFERALLVQAAPLLQDTVETRHELRWHRKSLWLIITGLVLAVVVAQLYGHAVVLIGGAAGAFMSRLWRALRSKTTPRDYLQNWTTLFLGPVAGALAGYFGVTIVRLLSDLDLLGTTLEPIFTSGDRANGVLALAFALGFSERLLDRLVEQAEDAVRAPRPSTDRSDVGGGGGGGAGIEPPPDGSGGAVAVVPGAEGEAAVPPASDQDRIDAELTALLARAASDEERLQLEARALRQSDNGSHPDDPEDDR